MSHRKLWPVVALVALLTAATFQLRHQGRNWWCACGQHFLWVGNIWSSHTSQHLLDPYAFTHVLHGFLFFWLLYLLVPRIPKLWQLSLAIGLEAIWEVFENTEFTIQRYRETTLALGYFGDSVANSLGDLAMCGLGFLLAQRLGLRRSFVVFALTELVLLIWIRDSLLFEVLMLIYPIDWLKAWQIGH
jgi:hypothetical protein